MNASVKMSGLLGLALIAGFGTIASAKSVAMVDARKPTAGLAILTGTGGGAGPAFDAASGRGPSIWWNNGSPDNRLAVQSQDLASINFSARVADDYFLEFGKWHYTDSIEVVMGFQANVSQTITPTFKLEMYDDCSGKPNNLLYTFTDDQTSPTAPKVVATALGPSSAFPGLTLYRVQFKNLNLFETGYQRRWISPVGVGQGVYFWISSNNGVIQGVQGQAKTNSGDPKYRDWTNIADFCCGGLCTDFNFRISGKICFLLKDNSAYALDGLSSIDFPNLSLASARSVDNFQIPPLEPLEICRIDAWGASNCGDVFLEIWTNVCNTPGQVIATLRNPIVKPTGERVSTGLNPPNDTMPVNCYTWILPGVTLAPGQNYWLSLVGNAPNTLFSNRSIFLFKQLGPCSINITEGQYRNAFFGFPNFTPVSNSGLAGVARDFAFRVYTNRVTTELSMTPTGVVTNLGSTNPTVVNTTTVNGGAARND
ncbi:MAG: hypothetical protein IBJ11_03910 [Phycisphaerales bacterium]|nr:hypothetical protein [Phycisphaerales bacterium]